MSHLFRNTTSAGNADLASEQNVLAGLRHRGRQAADTTRMAPSICAATGDHVLDVVGVGRGSRRWA